MAKPDMSRSGTTAKGDSRYSGIYVQPEGAPVDLALQVALATGRPLLVLGPSGGGKSAIAAYAAKRFKRRFLEVVMTARTTTDDLLYQLDNLERLTDANIVESKKDELYAKVRAPANYIRPGALWWALDPVTAGAKGTPPEDPVHQGSGNAPTDEHPAVLLIDEIDKAEPDVPDALLVPLGSLSFRVPQSGETIRAVGEPPLVIITSNQERMLSHPFTRRCIVYRIGQPNRNHLQGILVEHLGPSASVEAKPLLDRLFGREVELPKQYSIAEVLDMVRALEKVPRADLDQIIRLVAGAGDSSRPQ